MSAEGDRISLPGASAPPDISHTPADDSRKIVGETSLNRSILRLALPTMAGWYLQMMFNIIDAFWVGKLGPAALAAVGASTFALWTVYTSAEIFSTGSSAIIARRVGENNFAAATEFTGRMLLVVAAGAAIVGALGLLTVETLYDFINLSPQATRYGVDYLTIILCGAVFIFMAVWGEAVFHANGDAKTPMKILASALALNAIITPALIFGWGPFPRLEVAGAAAGTVFSQFIAVAVGLAVMARRGLLPKSLRKYLPSKTYALQAVKIGAPTSFTGFVFCLVFIYISRLASEFGDEPLAALAVGHRLEEFAWVINSGLYIAVVTVVGQFLGMKDSKSAVKAGWRSLWFGTAATAAVAVVFFFAGRYLIMPFSDDPKVLELGAKYLRINAPALVFMAPGIILTGALAGAGYTLVPMLVTVPIIALRIPFALLFAEDLGMEATGIYYALALAYVLRGTAMLILYTRVKWWRKKV